MRGCAAQKLVALVQTANSCDELRNGAMEHASRCYHMHLLDGLSFIACRSCVAHCTNLQCCDRYDANLPGLQLQLLQAIAGVGKPTVLVTVNAGMLNLTWAQTHIPAIVNGIYLGQHSGTAIAMTILGLHNPSGRLTTTVSDVCYYLVSTRSVGLANSHNTQIPQ